MLFSAAWRAAVSPALSLWTLSDLTLVTSPYAIAEAERNLEGADTRARLYRLIQTIEIANEAAPSSERPKNVRLPAKDWPILLTAIQASCTHLITGDHKHFGPLLGCSVKGVHVLTVRDYLTRRGIT